MTDIRALFCEAVDAATPLLAGPALVERFEKPSALAEFSVRGLAGHLLRAMTTPGTYLDGPEPDAAAPAISAAAYYASVAAAPADLDDPFQRAIRQRGLEAAPDTPEEFPGIWAATMARFRARLDSEPASRRVRVYGDMVLTLDEYLVTRLIELVVPADSRVDDYRSLHDAKIRRRMEEGGDGDPGFFVAEGGHAVERLLASGRRLRSVLLDRIRLEALGPALDGVDAPVLVADQPTLRA